MFCLWMSLSPGMGVYLSAGRFYYLVIFIAINTWVHLKECLLPKKKKNLPNEDKDHEPFIME